MPGLQMFKKSFYSHIGANQPIVAGTINLGNTKGRGSSTRMFNYCKTHSPNPSECINQFINITNSSAPSLTPSITPSITPSLTTNLSSSINKKTSDNPIEIVPISNSPGTIRHTSSNPSVATVNGSTLTMVGPGTTTITSSQEESGMYRGASVSSNLIVADDSSSTPALPPAIANAGTVNTTSSIAYKSTIGTSGTANGEFNSPCGIAIDSTGNIFVADTENNRIQEFNSSGNYVATYTPSSESNSFTPFAISINSQDGYAVADQGNSVILIFSDTGYQSELSNDNGMQEIQYPAGLSYDGSNNLYVSNDGFIAEYTNQTTSYSSSIQRVTNPGGVAIDPFGNIWVTDTLNSALVKLDSSGTLQDTYGSQGTGQAQFTSPQGIAIDNAGNIVVADTGNNRIQIFSSEGTFINSFGSFGNGNDQFNYPIGVAINKSGQILVADVANNRVQVWG